MLDGERVAVIGTGASSIQLVPRIQPKVGRLHVFQRTPPWIVPHRNRPTARLERRLLSLIPAGPAADARESSTAHASCWCCRSCIRVPVRCPSAWPASTCTRRSPTPSLRARLEPSYRIGCKRILISNDFYPALAQPNVELVTDSIRAITPNGIVTADGTERELDTIIFGTGFHVADMPVAEWLHGGDGRSLAEVWDGSPQAYLGATVAGFPNLFLLVGPNTGLGHNSIVFMIESQLHYLMECLRFMGRAGLDIIEVREHVQRRFNEEIQRRLQGAVWTSGGCASWYLDEHGRNATIWPGSTWPYRRRLRRFQPGDYQLRPRTARAGSGSPTPLPAA